MDSLDCEVSGTSPFARYAVDLIICCNRFSFVTGMKCMYPNFLNKEAVLVTNHREAGENYHSRLGSSDTLINSIPYLLHNLRGSEYLRKGSLDHAKYFNFVRNVTVEVPVGGEKPDDLTSLFLSFCDDSHDEHIWMSTVESSAADSYCATFCSSVLSVLQPTGSVRSQLFESLHKVYQANSRESYYFSSCLRSHFLPVSELSRWQYDYNLRRAGAIYSPDTVLEFDTGAAEYPKSRICSSDSISANDILSEMHWRYILHMLEGYVARSAPTLHFGCSYLTYAPVFPGGDSLFFKYSAVFKFNGTSFDSTRCVKSWKLSDDHKLDYECPSLVTNGTVLLSNFAKYMWVRSAEVAIVSVSGLSDQTINSSILSTMPRLRFILVLSTDSSTSCEFAPVNLFLPFSNIKFVLAENVCSLETDRGGLLYKRISDKSDSNTDNSSGISTRSTIRRHAGKLVSRAFFW